jgi:hypothetical protein
MECEVEGPAPDQAVGYEVEGPAPELRRLEVGDESLLGIQVEEWNRDGVPAGSSTATPFSVQLEKGNS